MDGWEEIPGSQHPAGQGILFLLGSEFCFTVTVKKGLNSTNHWVGESSQHLDHEIGHEKKQDQQDLEQVHLGHLKKNELGLGFIYIVVEVDGIRHSEFRWFSFRGHDKTRLMGVTSHRSFPDGIGYSVLIPYENPIIQPYSTNH